MPYAESGNLLTESREINTSDEWSSQSDWEANQEANSVALENGTIRLEEIPEIPASVVYQVRAEEFASPWPFNIGGISMTINGLSEDTFSNSEASVFGDGNSHGEASGPQTLPSNETFGVAFTAQFSDINPGGGAVYFAGSRDDSNDFFIRNDQNGPDGNVGLKLDDGANALRVYTDSTYDDGSVRTVVINKLGNGGSDIDIYVDGMTNPVSVTVEADEGFSHLNYDNTIGLGFWASLHDGSPNDNIPAHIGAFEFNTEPYNQDEREGFVTRRPEV